MMTADQQTLLLQAWQHAVRTHQNFIAQLETAIEQQVTMLHARDASDMPPEKSLDKDSWLAGKAAGILAMTSGILQAMGASRSAFEQQLKNLN